MECHNSKCMFLLYLNLLLFQRHDMDEQHLSLHIELSLFEWSSFYVDLQDQNFSLFNRFPLDLSDVILA